MLLDNIKAEAQLQGYTITELDEKLGFPKNTLYRWNAVEPSYKKVLKVAKFLGTTVEDLAKD